MKALVMFSSFLIFYFVYGYYISHIELNVIPQRLPKESFGEFYDYKGILNVHSDLSIGSSSPQQIIKSARSAGLDFIVLTDLNLFDAVDDYEGYNGHTLVFAGRKFSYLDSRLIFYSKIKESLGANLGEAQVRLADLLTQKFKTKKDELLILAHPFKTGFTWTGELPSGLDGMEIVNLKSLAFRAWEYSKLSVFWSLIAYPFNPKLSLIRLFQEPTEEINLFDQVSQQRKIFLYAGSEASARAIPWANYLMKFPSYQRSFEIFTNHILLQSELTGQAENDKVKIFSALKNGQFYISCDLIGDPKGFKALLDEGTKIYPLGSTVKFNKNLILRVEIPTAPSDYYEIVVYRNGMRYATTNSSILNLHLVEPGTYRVQVRVSPFLPLPDAKKWFTWIYTNPFFVVEKYSEDF